jgi:hypothetical protein
MKNKQVYIDLLNKALTVPEQKGICFYTIQDELINLLNKSKSQSLYTKQLTYLDTQFNKYYSNGGLHSDDLIKKIKDTIAILNTPLKELEDIETAIQRQLELDEYHKELPLKLLELLAEADELGIEYKVVKEKGKLTILFYRKSTKYGADAIISLSGEPIEYYELENFISTIKDYIKKEQQKADLIAAAKAKLTDEEKKLLGL